MPTRAAPRPGQRPYQPWGAAADLLYLHDPEVLLDGPAGTGKSRGCLEKGHLLSSKYPGARGLIVRKTRASLTQTAMVTFERQVLPVRSPVRFHGGDQEYRYPNGSVIVVGGMDKAIKVMSAEYDWAYVQEATELTEDDWESITTRLRNGVLPYQQIFGDVNPGPPTHWLNQRCLRKQTRRLLSRHQDNPVLWDRAGGTWTPKGAAYIAKLDALTGVRYKRLRCGLWVAAEGQVYADWDPSVHLIDRFDIPAEWARYRVVDFGYTNPFVCQWWAEDPDGRLYRYRELYGTKRLVEDWARMIRDLSGDEQYAAPVICDHDAEDRATLERHGLPTVRARKDVSPGIQAVQARLRPAGDGKPRLFLLRDSLVARDADLSAARQPGCTDEEIDGYVWEVTADGKPNKEQPHKDQDHGMDALRYLVYYRTAPRTMRYTPEGLY